MSIIVADKTFLECDRCRKQSEPRYDQMEAIRLALSKGWYHSDIDGRALCPACISINSRLYELYVSHYLSWI